MPVQKLFWDDPYLTEVEAAVTSANGDVVTLDRTIAYAFSGGQQSDSGTIGGHEILDARCDGLEIRYTIPSGHTLKTGDRVAVTIDGDKRYRIMRLHFAAELVLELVYQNYGRPEKIGANITTDKARVDFYWDGSIAETFMFLENRIRELVDANLDIVSEFTDEREQRRRWRIDGFAEVACGGTHPKKTGEVGQVKLKRNNIGGGKERIEIYLPTS
jgi:Ser-tRNA(Ala) deacylase AlaX